jgi:hypothetical protein
MIKISPFEELLLRSFNVGARGDLWSQRRAPTHGDAVSYIYEGIASPPKLALSAANGNGTPM